jgi:hypothetical protein
VTDRKAWEGDIILRRHHSTFALKAAAVVLGAGGAASIANGAEQYGDPFVLKSMTFEDGGSVPVRIAFTKGPDNPVVVQFGN